MVRLKPVQFRSFRQVLSDWDAQSPNNFFYPRFYVRYFGVIPITIWAMMDCVWMAFCSIKGFQRTDVVLSRNGIKSKQQGELTELLLKPVNRKFFTFYQTFEPNPDLYNAYEEMKKAEKNCRVN